MTHRSSENRHMGLDFLKYLCAFCVVCIHMPFPFENQIQPVMRSAVPLFFMVTGYFYESVARKGLAAAQIKKIIRLLLWAYLLYIGWDICTLIVRGESLAGYLRGYLQPILWIKFLLFNASLTYGHLWYLGALIYALALILLADTLFGLERLYPWIPVLLLGNLVLGCYSAPLLGFRAPLLLTRNFLLSGLPFLLLGDWVRRRSPKIRTSHLLAAVFLLLITVSLENQFLRTNYPDFNEDCFASTPLLALALFLLTLRCERHLNYGIPAFFAVLGKKTSTTVYILHPLMITLLGRYVTEGCASCPGFEQVYYVTGPFVICAVCTVIGLLLSRIPRGRKS